MHILHTQDNLSRANEKTEAEIRSVDGHAGRRSQSSHNAKSHIKAGRIRGAGGGKKQERHH